MSETQQLEKGYKEAIQALDQLYTSFGDIPGYIREKKGEELAIQEAKKIFGRFSPNDHDLMESNTNNGQGYTLVSDEGQEIHLPNQLALFKRVVEFNKSLGGFCDEDFIELNNQEDFRTLCTLKLNVELAKDNLVNACSTKKEGYEKAREIEVSAKAEKYSNSNGGNVQNSSLAEQSNKSSVPEYSNAHIPLLRTPLLSSIPNTFRQVKALFNANTQKKIQNDNSVTNFFDQNKNFNYLSLNEKLSINLLNAKALNAELSKPVTDKTESIIKTMSNDFDVSNEAIDASLKNTSAADSDDLFQYNKKMKSEMDAMQRLAKEHPLDIVRSMVGKVLQKMMSFIKNITEKAKFFITNKPETSL